MRRIAVTAFAAGLLLGLCGCFMPFGVAYPNLSYTPSVPLDLDDVAEIHAFRVDFTENHRPENQADWVKCEFQEIDTAARQEVPGQLKAAITYSWGWYFFPGAGQAYKGSVRSNDQWVRVRLYRRDYKTIEVGPDDPDNRRLDWEKARDTEEQEESIDTLVGTKKDFLGHLRPGTASPKHQAFLLFAADEYEHLADSIVDDTAAKAKQRFHLLKKVEDLRRIADKKPVEVDESRLEGMPVSR